MLNIPWYYTACETISCLLVNGILPSLLSPVNGTVCGTEGGKKAKKNSKGIWKLEVGSQDSLHFIQWQSV